MIRVLVPKCHVVRDFAPNKVTYLWLNNKSFQDISLYGVYPLGKLVYPVSFEAFAYFSPGNSS